MCGRRIRVFCGLVFNFMVFMVFLIEVLELVWVGGIFLRYCGLGWLVFWVFGCILFCIFLRGYRVGGACEGGFIVVFERVKRLVR